MFPLAQNTIVISSNVCSFCGGLNHTIKTCNSDLITQFAMILHEQKNVLTHTYTLHKYDKVKKFTEWLNSYNVKMNIKAYAVKDCNCKIGDSLNTCIQSIVKHVWEIK